MSSSEPTKPDYSGMLNGWLTEWYETTVLGCGKPSDTLFRFDRIATIQPELRAEAVKRLASIEAIADERCFITKTNKEFLRKVTNHE